MDSRWYLTFLEINTSLCDLEVLLWMGLCNCVLLSLVCWKVFPIVIRCYLTRIVYLKCDLSVVSGVCILIHLVFDIPGINSFHLVVEYLTLVSWLTSYLILLFLSICQMMVIWSFLRTHNLKFRDQCWTWILTILIIFRHFSIWRFFIFALKTCHTKLLHL